MASPRCYVATLFARNLVDDQLSKNQKQQRAEQGKRPMPDLKPLPAATIQKEEERLMSILLRSPF